MRMRRKTATIVVAITIVAFCVVPEDVQAMATPTEWNSLLGGTATGTVDSVGVTLSGLSSPFIAINTSQNLNTPDFAGEPLVNVDTINYGATNNWTVNFSETVSGLLLYVTAWRGAFTFFDDPAVQYTFSQPFTVVSGLTTAGFPNNQTLILDDDVENFHNGIILFSNPINSLSLQVTTSGFPNNESGQILTFALRPVTAVPVPEPATTALGLMSLGVLGMATRRRMA